MNFFYILGMVMWFINMVNAILDKDAFIVYLSLFSINILFVVIMIQNTIKEK